MSGDAGIRPGIGEQLERGTVVAEARYPIDRNTLVHYAGASGDFNPIHYRDDVATGVGLPGVIAHGMLTMGVAVQPVVEWAGGVGRITDYQVRFTRMVPVPPEGQAELVVTATVGAVDDAHARIDLTVSAGDQTVLGKAQVQVSLAP